MKTVSLQLLLTLPDCVSLLWANLAMIYSLLENMMSDLIFEAKHIIKLSTSEVFGLAYTGLANYSSEIVPLELDILLPGKKVF